VKLISYLHLVSKLRIVELYLRSLNEKQVNVIGFNINNPNLYGLKYFSALRSSSDTEQ
jgi:hypothetical protein